MIGTFNVGTTLSMSIWFWSQGSIIQEGFGRKVSVPTRLLNNRTNFVLRSITNGRLVKHSIMTFLEILQKLAPVVVD